jgi:hypothetical protein
MDHHIRVNKVVRRTQIWGNNLDMQLCVRQIHFQKHFEQFLKEHNLKQGKAWVEGFILFYVYDKWCYETNKKTQLANSFFISFCKLYFKHKQNNDKAKLWFGVNDEFMMNHLTPEKIKTIQQARDKKYEKKQKIKNKIPSTKT